MDYQELFRKKELYSQCRGSIPDYTLFTFEQAFEIEYTHNSTAIEGNTLSLIETKVLLEDGISIGGKALREIYEAVNHRKAFRYVKKCTGKGMLLDEKIIKDIHALLMENIQVGGVYRDVQVYISGARHMPPSPPLMYRQVKDFYADLSWKGKELNQIELAAWTHAEFVKIHPFMDGNGRTSRLIVNYQLMTEGFPAISIAKEDRLEYFKMLDAYSVEGTCSRLRTWWQGLWTDSWNATLNFPVRSRKGASPPQCSKAINRKNFETAECRMQECVRCFLCP